MLYHLKQKIKNASDNTDEQISEELPTIVEEGSVDNTIKTVIKVNEDKLQFIILTCTNCNESTKAAERDSDNCPKCTTKLVFSCGKCDKQLADAREALSHRRENCKIEILHSCTNCSAKYSRKYDLQRHFVDNHGSAQPVECPRCLGAFKNKKNLKEHLKICNRSPHLLCSFCTYKTKYKQNVRFHLLLKHPEKFKAPGEHEAVCEDIFRRGADRSKYFYKTAKHTQKRKEVDSGSAESIECPHCYCQHKNKGAFRRHVKHCIKPAHLACVYCSFTTHYAKNMRSHLLGRHIEEFWKRRQLKDVYEKILEIGKAMQKKMLASRNETEASKNEPSTESNVPITNQEADTKNCARTYVASKSTQYCPQCDKIVDVTGTYNKKKCALCNSPTAYQCNKCNYRRKSYTSFKFHLNKVCFPRGILNCNNCDYTTLQKYRLRIHIINKHLFLPADAIAEIMKSASNKQRKKLSSEKAAKKRVSDRSRKPLYVASKCNYYCPQCKDLVDVKGIYNEKQCMKCNTRTIYQCKKCKHQCQAYTSIVHHVNKVCYPKMMNFCTDCDYSTPMKHRLRYHIANKHLFTADPTMFECDKCPFNTYSKSAFTRHIDHHVLKKVSDAVVPPETIKTSEKDQPSGSGKKQPSTSVIEQPTTSGKMQPTVIKVKRQPTTSEKEQPTSGIVRPTVIRSRTQPTTSGKEQATSRNMQLAVIRGKTQPTTSGKVQPSTTGTTSEKEQPTSRKMQPIAIREKKQPTTSGKEQPTSGTMQPTVIEVNKQPTTSGKEQRTSRKIEPTVIRGKRQLITSEKEEATGGKKHPTVIREKEQLSTTGTTSEKERPTSGIMRPTVIKGKKQPTTSGKEQPTSGKRETTAIRGKEQPTTSGKGEASTTGSTSGTTNGKEQASTTGTTSGKGQASTTGTTSEKVQLTMSEIARKKE